MKKLVMMLAVLIVAGKTASADQRLLFRIDYSIKTIDAYGHEVQFSWRGLQGEYEKEWKTNKIFVSGFSIGVRSEGSIPYEGTYLTAGTFKRIPVGKFFFYPGVTMLYGVPGIGFDRTWETRDGDVQQSYAHLYPIRNIDIPSVGRMDLRKFGWLYPELTLAVRKDWKCFTVDGVAGVRIMPFGEVESDFSSAQTQSKLEFVPTMGLRVGIKF